MEALSFASESPVPFMASWQYNCGRTSTALDDEEGFILLKDGIIWVF